VAYIVEDFETELSSLKEIVGEGILSNWEEEFILSMNCRNCDAPLSFREVEKIEEIMQKAQLLGGLNC
jgi:hypothetical protein